MPVNSNKGLTIMDDFFIAFGIIIHNHSPSIGHKTEYLFLI